MGGSSFGERFRITTFGESHGGGVGVVVDGCPAGLPLTAADIQVELDRRRPGQSRLVTQRQEADEVEIYSGVFEDLTLGSSIGMLVHNTDARPGAYDNMRDLYRPSHADYTTEAKFGRRRVIPAGSFESSGTKQPASAASLLENVETVLYWQSPVRSARSISTN